MNADWLHLFVPVVCLGLNVVAQVLVFRLAPRWGLLKSIVAGFCLGLVAVIALEVWIDSPLADAGPAAWGMLAANAVLYVALGYGYFHFVNLGETARRVRILRELYAAPDGLSEPDLLRQYNADHVVHLRLQRLLRNRQLLLSHGRYTLGRPTLLLFARLLLALKWLLLEK